ncbi:hypothetical protein QFC21_003292 [Naganishia friedmannii]|uniref:Uncharacterized protein n=1 Tax=Naganishia friedmannii TaxID=89922 RepID=A0ACC2VPP3_9TREE|nr:hypothetical protein QFC21_003292 [Naganishia friedmannii]
MSATLSDTELGHYEILADFKLGFAPIRVFKLRSKVTGMRVVVADYRAPVINAYAVLATETFDDKGLPHTLEHLTFMGSKSYPYKGALDLLASRAGADSLSAWTAIDHTAYTISSAGPEGFMNMLPVYLEHILYPTLTKEGFLSEIYHVDGNGEEGGVVFCEMQGIEQSSGRVLMRYANRETNPPGSGYRSVTGGLLNDIRQLTIEQIREFHKHNYKPWNLCLHVDGSVPLGQLLQVLNKVVDPMIVKNAGGPSETSPPENWQRPWLEPVPTAGPVIEKESKHTVRFMSDDETVGAAMMVWKGPAIENHMAKTALKILTTYLNDSETAPFSQQLMEIKNPACTSIEFSIEDGAMNCVIDCVIEGIPHCVAQGTNSRLYHIESEVKAVFEDVVPTGIDMRKMQTVILKQSRMLLKRAEDDITDLLVSLTFDDFLYSSNDAELAARMDIHARYKTLLSWTNEQWIDLLDTYFIANPCAVIIGEPSASLANQVDEEGKVWVQTVKARLGEKGLQQKADELAAAEKANHRDIPADSLTNFPVSDASKIEWVSVESGINSAFLKCEPAAGRVQAYLDADLTNLPYLVHFSHIESNFVTIRAMLDTSIIPEECRPIGVIIGKLIQKVPDCYRDPEGLVGSTLNSLVQDETKSSAAAVELWNRASFLPRLQKEMQNNPSAITDKLSRIRDLLVDPSGVRLSVAGNILGLPEPRSAWTNNFLQSPDRVRKISIQDGTFDLASSDSLSGAHPFCTASCDQAVIVPMGSIEGSHAVVYSRGPQGWTHPDLPACVVTSAILQATESYFWKGVRGAGLAYHTYMTINAEFGSIVFNVLRSPNCVKAVVAAGNIVRGLVDGSVVLDVNILDAARSSLAYTYAKKECNVSAAASASHTGFPFLLPLNPLCLCILQAMTVMVNEVFKGVPAKANANFLASLSLVTIDHVKAAVIKYFAPLFDPASSIMAVTCASGLVPRIQKDLEDNGYHVQIKEMPKAVEQED